MIFLIKSSLTLLHEYLLVYLTQKMSLVFNKYHRHFVKKSLLTPQVYYYHCLIGLTQSEKTSVMSTVKCLGTHIWQITWQIYPSSGI